MEAGYIGRGRWPYPNRGCIPSAPAERGCGSTVFGALLAVPRRRWCTPRISGCAATFWPVPSARAFVVQHDNAAGKGPRLFQHKAFRSWKVGEHGLAAAKQNGMDSDHIAMRSPRGKTASPGTARARRAGDASSSALLKPRRSASFCRSASSHSPSCLVLLRFVRTWTWATARTQAASHQVSHYIKIWRYGENEDLFLVGAKEDQTSMNPTDKWRERCTRSRDPWISWQREVIFARIGENRCEYEEMCVPVRKNRDSRGIPNKTRENPEQTIE